MATTPMLDPNAPAPPAETAVPTPELLVWVAGSATGPAFATLGAVEAAFDGRPVLVASSDPAPAPLPPNVRWIAARGAPRLGWVLTAGDYLEAAQLAREHNATHLLLLGAHNQWVTAQALRALVETGSARPLDLVLPRLPGGAEEGLVNVALLYPLTRALFAADIHYPLPTDALVSMRMAERLSAAAQRAPSPTNEALVWPVSEAAVSGFSVREVPLADYTLPHPPETAFNELFASVAGALFADIEAKATFWQRARAFAPGPAASPPPAPTSSAEVSTEVRLLVENFRLAYKNLHEIWSLILPPQTLLALKRLSLGSPESFSLAPQVWARIVYDFALAFRLRTINRGHLLGAFTPLYMAWVASHARATEADPAAGSRLMAETAQAFEIERPYVVSRWRWPDRFNP